MNCVTVVGNVGRDAEVRFNEKGMASARFTVASNIRRMRERKAEDAPVWFNVVVFGKTAEFAGQYVKRGRRVFVSGPLEMRKLEDGREFMSLLADRLEMLSDGKGRDEGTVTSPGTASAGGGDASADEDDLPF